MCAIVTILSIKYCLICQQLLLVQAQSLVAELHLSFVLILRLQIDEKREGREERGEGKWL